MAIPALPITGEISRAMLGWRCPVVLEPLLGQFGPMVRQVTKLKQDSGWRIINPAQRQGF